MKVGAKERFYVFTSYEYENIVFTFPLHSKIFVHIFLQYHIVSYCSDTKVEIGYDNKLHECGFSGEFM